MEAIDEDTCFVIRSEDDVTYIQQANKIGETETLCKIKAYGVCVTDNNHVYCSLVEKNASPVRPRQVQFPHNSVQIHSFRLESVRHWTGICWLP